MTDRLEKMDDFFAARVEDYDTHMITNVVGCKEGYLEMARRIPSKAKRLLDLGCGTGLELKPIFDRFADLQVVGIDLTKEMLDKLALKYATYDISLICGDYFDVNFGKEFDVAVSFETMHHFEHEPKLDLYRKIYQSLNSDGQYIEADYMVQTLAEEKTFFAENKRLRALNHLPPEVFYHFDIPCCVENQIKLLLQAGFKNVQKVWNRGNTVMLRALK